MKFKLNHIFIFKLIAVLFLTVSCGSDDDSLQRIDQIMNFDVRNSVGQDLMNPKSPDHILPILSMILMV